LRRLEELGIVLDASRSPPEARTEAAPAARPIVVRADAPSPATRSPAGSGKAISCARCSKVFTPRPRAGGRARYCSARCRIKAAAERKVERAAAEVRRQTVAVMEQAERDGFPSTLSWSSNGDATSTQID
jgi:hypothetical protein